MTDPLRLELTPGELAVSRLAPDAPVPAWAAGPFWSVTRTPAELSVVCPAEAVPAEVTAERGWRSFRVAGPLDFALVGILARLTAPLAAEGISIFALSTYDTDYLLVRAADVARAAAALRRAGCAVSA